MSAHMRGCLAGPHAGVTLRAPLLFGKQVVQRHAISVQHGRFKSARSSRRIGESSPCSPLSEKDVFLGARRYGARQAGREIVRAGPAAVLPEEATWQRPGVEASGTLPEEDRGEGAGAEAVRTLPEQDKGREAGEDEPKQDARQASHAEASGSGEGGQAGANPRPKTLKGEAIADRDAIADKLIAVFEQRGNSEWRKLIAFSKQWPSLADSVFARIETRSQASMEVDRRLVLRRLGRRLRKVHQELLDYNTTLANFRAASEEEWEAMVTSGRDQLPADFFEHLENCIRAVPPEKQGEREELINLAARLLALVSAYDQMAANEGALDAAADKFQDLLQVESLAEADAKIDALAASGQLDPALLLTMAKAYSASKDTDVTREEVKDIMAHLYFKAKESFAKMQPPEVRILKHLLSLDDPKEREDGLREAFTPGAELETSSQDFLTTTPDRLLVTIEAVLNAFESSQGQATMLGQAGELMRPEVINRMQIIRDRIMREYK